MFATVLLPIDRSREAAEASTRALELAREHGSRVVLLAVVEAEREAMQDPARVAELLERARQPFAAASIACEVLEREGKPAFVICDVADEIDADLIVMSTRGVSIEEDEHSTASRVIQLSPCPVLVVP
ncbi:universal stress protein [Synechococcus sp. RSCCF101]|uniref:universal stress protein n=1 Tax=Synechococcus sp. RSCCF101 TaxID=2511069 RepID=UPI001248BA07|nr:universal stress protein [Synechococcus sp. RSCCF101]QEY32819.1 universal stress protein [Synechococcus sp. RSCCF101]